MLELGLGTADGVNLNLLGIWTARWQVRGHAPRPRSSSTSGRSSIFAGSHCLKISASELTEHSQHELTNKSTQRFRNCFPNELAVYPQLI